MEDFHGIYNGRIIKFSMCIGLNIITFAKFEFL